jgi:hypothetical protein
VLVEYVCGSYGREAQCGAFGQTFPVYSKYVDQVESEGNSSQTLSGANGSVTWWPLTDTCTRYYVNSNIYANELGTTCWLDQAGQLDCDGPAPNVGVIQAFSANRWSSGYIWNWYALDQSDYTDKYGFTNATIKQVGSQLTTYAMHLVDNDEYTVIITPSQLNDWLKTAPDGYIGDGLINPLAVLRYGRVLKETNPYWGYCNLKENKGCRTGVVLKEAMHRAFERFVDVGGGHWVLIISYQVDKGANSALIRHRMVDPDYKRKGTYVVEEAYGSVVETSRNTVVFYDKIDWQMRKRFNSFPPGMQTDWGYSGIYAGTTDPSVTKIELLKGSEVVSTSINERVRNDETGQVFISGQMLAYTWLPQDTYRLRVTGSGPYTIKAFIYDKDGNPTSYSFEGSRSGYFSLPYCANADLGTMSKDFCALAIGSTVRVYGGQVIGVVEGGFYVRPILSLVPSVFVKTSTVPLSYCRIKEVAGTVREEQGQKIIDASSVVTETWTNTYATVGVVPEKVSTTFHTLCRTVGRVTKIGPGEFVLNNCLTVKSDVLVSDSALVVVEGVEHRGKFYANDVQDGLQ